MEFPPSALPEAIKAAKVRNARIIQDLRSNDKMPPLSPASPQIHRTRDTDKTRFNHDPVTSIWRNKHVTEDQDNEHTVSFKGTMWGPVFKLDGMHVCPSMACGYCYGCHVLSDAGKTEMKMFMDDMTSPDFGNYEEEDDEIEDPDYIPPSQAMDDDDETRVAPPPKKRRKISHVFVAPKHTTQ